MIFPKAPQETKKIIKKSAEITSSEEEGADLDRFQCDRCI